MEYSIKILDRIFSEQLITIQCNSNNSNDGQKKKIFSNIKIDHFNHINILQDIVGKDLKMLGINHWETTVRDQDR